MLLNENGDAVQLQLLALCRAFSDTDDWGREFILNTALGQAAKRPRTAATSRSASKPLLDEGTHLADDVVDSLSLPLIRKPVDPK